ncbi:MAG: Na+/H+ antiporter NhaA [Planctomycetes bacterium]|nr:Na+/H+ antiporter NhaA [Planctomycetota bacterium]
MDPAARTPLERLLVHLREVTKDSPRGAMILLAATAAAMLAANSPWSDAWARLWATPLAVSLGPWTLSETLHHWVNDGLMAVFFFAVGLEIKREVVEGELSSLRRAALPLVAALGGMVAPAGLFLLLNAGAPGAAGWGVPMATDIAFALGVLALLGDRVPVALKVFLMALAVVDDIGAVLVIAVFYTDQLHLPPLLLGVGAIAAAAAANLLLGVRRPLAYFAVGLVAWFGFLESGVHATLAAVAMALTIPAAPVRRADRALHERMGELRDLLASSAGRQHLDHRQLVMIEAVEEEIARARPPLLRLERRMGPLVSLFVLPVFALANAGVPLGRGLLDGLLDPVFLGVALGLLVGKPLGICAFSWVAVRLRLGELPGGATWRQLAGVGVLAGIGFTMSLFIAGLAFPGAPGLQDAAKVGVLAASFVAALLGVVLLGLTAGPAPAAARARRRAAAAAAT